MSYSVYVTAIEPRSRLGSSELCSIFSYYAIPAMLFFILPVCHYNVKYYAQNYARFPEKQHTCR